MFVYCRILCIQESLSRENSGGFILTMSGFDNDDPRGGKPWRGLVYCSSQLTKSTSWDNFRPILTVILSVLFATGLETVITD